MSATNNFSFLKGQCHEICYFRFFYEPVSPKPLCIPLVPFRFFSKNRNSRCVTGVVATGGNVKNLQYENYLSPVSTTPAVPVGKFTAGVIDTGGAP
jgi:hypothetical protein